jgi:hypothetical protein
MSNADLCTDVLQRSASGIHFMISVSFSVANNHCLRMQVHLLLTPESFKGLINKKEGF